MPITPGTTLGPYAVTGKIGEGGMGEVYQARDTKLDRDVALKVLPEAFTSDTDRMARFEREAKVLASLNHTNIGGIYGLEDSGDVRALVLELVEGPTLADRIAQGPIPVEDALPIATQIAEALEAAHESGVIHRDLKPANIKVRDDGTVKVLDFGLAKAFQPETADPNMSLSPTISLTAAATQMGMVIGTAAYMAPEQAKGKPVDRRADVWAFGAVLFEMLTGQRPFVGDDVSDTLALVLKFEPDWQALPPEAPARIRQLIQTCLQKDPKRRIHSMADVLLVMEGAFDTPVSAPPASVAESTPRLWQRPVPAAMLGLALLVLGGVVWGLAAPTPPAPRLGRFLLSPPAPLTVGLPANSSTVAISPDGTRVVYTATGGAPYQLYVRAVEELTATPLPGLDDRVFGPFISPDSAWVGFNDQTDEMLKKVSIRGGPPVTIAKVDSGVRGASWGPDDTIVFGTGRPGGLWRVSSNGGEPEVLTTPDPQQDSVNHVWPHILPGGRAVLFTILDGAVENAQIAVLDLDAAAVRVLVPGGSHPRYVATGHLIFGAGGALRAVGFDLEQLAVTDPNPVPVVDGVVSKASGSTDFDVALDGSLVYVKGEVGTTGGYTSTPVWVDRDGREEAIAMPSRSYRTPRLSPDGERWAVGIFDSENTDVWLSQLARSTLSRLTTAPGLDGNPLWTRDGERVVFSSNLGGRGAWTINWRDPDGSDAPERLVAFEGGEASDVRPEAWSDDGQLLVFSYRGPGTNSDIGVLTMTGERVWEPLLQADGSESSATISPDGDWIAYNSDESGVLEVYVQRFPGLGDRQQISTGGGFNPVWSPEGRELFYRTDTAMMAVPVEPGETLEVGSAEVLFDGMEQYVDNFARDRRAYDVSPDGQRFMMLKSPGTATDPTPSAPQVILVQNWLTELERLVPKD